MEKSMPKVSIIVPIYNVEKYLSKCIESIINQSYKNLEIILINDGSSDKSGEIADNYAKKDSRISVLHQQNSGVSSARNVGINIAKGDYICFADADDYLMEDYVEYLLNLILEGGTDISLTTEMFGNFDLKQEKNKEVDILTAEEATEEILCYKIPIGVYCKMFKRSFLGNDIRFLSELFIGEGFNFNTTAFQLANKVAVGHKKIYYYRRDNSTSATTKFSAKKWENGLYALEVIRKNFIIKSRRIEKAWNFANWRTHSDVYDKMVLACVEKKYPDLYNRSKKGIRRNALYSLLVPTSKEQRIRAMIMFVYPKIIPKIMVLRNKRYNVNLDNGLGKEVH